MGKVRPNIRAIEQHITIALLTPNLDVNKIENDFGMTEEIGQ